MKDNEIKACDWAIEKIYGKGEKGKLSQDEKVAKFLKSSGSKKKSKYDDLKGLRDE